MRGAGLRLNNDVRRRWLCPACGNERRVGAEVTSVTCECSGNPRMKLMEKARIERPLKEPVSPYLEFVFEPGELNPPRPPVEEENSEPDSLDELPGQSPALEGASDGGGGRNRQETRPQRRSLRREEGKNSADRPAGRHQKSDRALRESPSDQSSQPESADPGQMEIESKAEKEKAANQDNSDDFGAGL